MNADMAGALKTLLENGANPNGKDDSSGYTALHEAVRTVVSRAPDLGMDTVRYVWNETALRLLLEHGASATVRSLNGTTPLHIAAMKSNTQFFNLVATTSADQEQLLLPSDLHLTNTFNKNLLHFACLGGNCDMVETLLNHGLDVDERSSLGWTPLMYALAPDPRDHDERPHDWTIKGLESAVQTAHLLITRGADTRIKGNRGWTRLHLLSLWEDSGKCQNGAYHLALQLLMGNKAALEAPEPDPMPEEWTRHSWCSYWCDKPKKNVSLLQWAVERRCLSVAKALLENGADPMATDANGTTAIITTHKHHRLQNTEFKDWF
jgi:ankyrin repeat protein